MSFNDRKNADTFNFYFRNITDSLDITKWNTHFTSSSNNPVQTAIEKYSSHPSVKNIKSSLKKDSHFKFSNAEPPEVLKIINQLDCSKKVGGNIPVKVLKLSSKCIINFLTDCINANINEGNFPNELKLANITPVFKTGD